MIHIAVKLRISLCFSLRDTWSDNKVCELIAVKVLHTSLPNTTMVAFTVLPLGSYALMTAPSPPFKTILELVLWNGLQNCHFITPDVINAIKMPSFQYFLYLREQKNSSHQHLSDFVSTFSKLTRNLIFVRCCNSSSDILTAAHQNTCRQ